MPNPIRVRCLDHVSLVVCDLDASRRFYVDLLGMELVARPAFEFAGLWFRAGATLVHVILEHDGSGSAGVNEDGRAKSTRGHHIAFTVEDAFAASVAASAAGFAVVAGPKHRPDGAIQTFVLDPDGHLIELSSPPPGNGRM